MEATNTRTKNAPAKGWRQKNETNSLSEVFRSVRVPKDAGFFRTLMAYVGPGMMVAVGYMDPGNWATDIAGGARFGYRLLSVVLISNLFAMLLQHLSLKLGIATGRDLAQACRTSSIFSCRASAPSTARKVGWASACPWPGTWSGCTTGRCRRTVRVSDRAPPSKSDCRGFQPPTGWRRPSLRPSRRYGY